MNQAAFVLVRRLAIRVSSEKNPGPKVRIIKEAIRKVQGAALINLSPSEREKTAFRASRSAMI